MTSARARRAHKREPLPGFEGVGGFFDSSGGSWVTQVLPGEFYVTKTDEIVTTVLGSCVATCIRDPRAGVAGMNHFMLPEDPSGEGDSSARYGVFAMEQLVNGVMRWGGRRESFEKRWNEL